MRRAPLHPVRNKIDLTDPVQIRVLARRWGISADDLTRTVGKVGNSIAAVGKEINLRKALPTKPVLPLPIAAASLATLQATADAAAQAGDN
jgi:hypothetical protein